MDYGIDRTNSLIRLTIREHNIARIDTQNKVIDDAIAFFDRQTDHESIQAALKQRFAMGIEKTAEGYETYTKGATAEALDQGLFEVVTSGVGNKIIDALANLFTSPTQFWKYLTANDSADDAAELVKHHRKAGGFAMTAVNWDSLSCAVNSGFLLITWVGGHLTYRVVSPTAINWIYNSVIIDNGVERGVDYSEIDDATVVVIKLSDAIDSTTTRGVSSTDEQFLAIFGRSKEYEYGRYVNYRANKWYDIPDIGTPGAIDYKLPNGQVANPLSWLAELNPDLNVPDYPIVHLDGGLSRMSSNISDTTSSLYENMIEIDMAYSRLLKDALSAARGKDVVTNTTGNSIPRVLEGAVVLSDGQELEVTGRPAINSKFALDVLEGLVVVTGNGYSVPDYVLVSDPSSLSASSGVALAIRTKPLIKFREYRINSNAASIDRIWQIEKGLIEVYAGDPSLRDVQQVWQPGELEIPEDETERLNRIAQAQKEGYNDYVGSVQEYHKFATIEEAEAFIKAMEDRAGEFQPPQQPQQIRGAQPVGLTRSQV